MWWRLGMCIERQIKLTLVKLHCGCDLSINDHVADCLCTKLIRLILHLVFCLKAVFEHCSRYSYLKLIGWLFLLISDEYTRSYLIYQRISSFAVSEKELYYVLLSILLENLVFPSRKILKQMGRGSFDWKKPRTWFHVWLRGYVQFDY